VTGPGIPEEKPIPFNGSAFTKVEVKGPPTFNVKVTHPDAVVPDVLYELKVEITNTGEIPAMYASLELDVGADAQLVKCQTEQNGNPVCTDIDGAEVRNFGHILPGASVSEVFTVKPLKEGYISSCVGVSDQNITLQVFVGNMGCAVGKFPPLRGVPDGIPTVTVTPSPNAVGIRIDTPVVAFFSEEMDEKTIRTGDGGTFNIYDRGNRIVPGQLRFELINGKTVAIWQADESMQYRLAFDTKYTVILTKDIRDKDGNSIFNEWNSWFTTTATGMFDTTPPTVSLSIEPPVNPNFVLPGQLVKIHAYASDQGSGVGRVEARLKDLDEQGGKWILFDQKSVFANDKPPYIFTIDSAKLILGHSYQIMVTAYDVVGNAQNATISIIMGLSADPPTIELPDDPAEPVLHGISVDVTPVRFFGGITQVRFYLNGQLYNTVNLPPYQTSIRTLGLPLGRHHVRAVAIDGLGQMGEDSLEFSLIENRNMPTVNFSGMTSGVQVVSGENILIRGNAVDPVGVASLKYYLDSPTGNPIFTGLAPILLNTTGLSLGEHTIYLLATNLLGVTNDINDPASALTFNVVQPPPGVPPAAPSISSISYPVNNIVTLQGSSVGRAKIVITNPKLGLQVNYQANSAGNFSGQIEASIGDVLTVVAYDLSKSPDPSQPTQVTVPAPPVLTGINVSPQAMNFTAANQYQDIVVTASYNDGTTANVTMKATYSSSNPASVSVSSSGRVVALAHGTSTISVSFGGFQAQLPVTCVIITLISISVDPVSINFITAGQTQYLTVTGHYSDGSSGVLTSGNTFITGNPNVATVSSSGLVTAKGDGNTQISVSRSGIPPISVPVTVSTAQDPPPTVAIVSPANGAMVERGQAVSVLVRAQDAIGGVSRIYLEVTGQTIYSDLKQISPALDVTREFTFAVSPIAQVGGSINVTVRAEDTSGKMSDPAAINLIVVDKTAPSVTITQPANNTPFNYGDTVNITVSAADAVGVTQIRYQTTGALSYSGTQNFPLAPLSANASFSFVIPFGVQNPDVRIFAYARDATGNERASIPVDIILTNADITPPETVIIAVANPGTSPWTTITYEITSGLSDLDHVEIYFRRNGIGTFNRYTDADGGNPEGKYFPQSGNIGTLIFDSTKMGGDGTYEFYSVGVDKAGNREPSPKDGSGNVYPDQTMAFNAGTVWTLITTPTVIGEGDPTYDNQNIRVVGTTLTVNGYHRFKNIDLLQNATLTHSETTLTTEYGLDIEAWTITVDSTSKINVDGRGYLGGMREGNDCTGQTIGNTNGSAYRSGGSYGGLGGVFDGGPPNPIYGSLTDPADLGSGGSCGAWNRQGGDGGGKIQLRAINISSDGPISTNGGAGTGDQAGSGSGGSIRIISSTLSGNGIVSANGGAGEVGGGGGRIAVYFIDISTKDTSQIVSLGGQGNSRVGGNGTIYLRGVSETNGTLVIDGQGATTVFTPIPIPPGYVFDNIIIRNNARVIVDHPITVNDTLKVSSNSVLTHSLTSEAGLLIQARRVEVDGTSLIDVSGKGYRGGIRDGNTSCNGETLGGVSGAVYRSGGSYGGYGGVFEGVGNNLPYGTPWDPVYLGSGGSCGAWNRQGGHGGGLIKIMATEAVVVEGSILANGGIGGGDQAGNGSGGSIKIVTSLLKGTGTISANGGVGEVGGGGGRVAITYDYLGGVGEDFDGLRKISAFGGHGNSRC